MARTEKWLLAALDYLPRWVEHQLRLAEQPGCSFAVALHGKPLAEFALGSANLAAGEALTPRHRFRVASHSKTFTAVGVLKLREQGRWRLDDPVGRYVGGLASEVSGLTLQQLLSHGSGLTRDGTDAGQWSDRKPFLSEAELRADLAAGTVLPPGSRFKYSNHGFGLLGLAISAVTGQAYTDWITREVIAPAGLDETMPDGPPLREVPCARGHSAKWPLGRRLVIPGDNPTNALAAATGFVSTARDLVRFFASLDPEAPPASRRTPLLSAASRRELLHRRWRDPYGSVERWYGLGTISGSLRGRAGDWAWFGHTGGFQGTLTRTVHVPAQGLTLSALTNAADGPSQALVDGALHILQAYAHHGAPGRATAAWQGRWWSLWNAFDLLPTATRVLVANPALGNPLLDAPEIEPQGRAKAGALQGRIVLAGGFASHGEGAELQHDAQGRAQHLRLGGIRYLPQAAAERELRQRYGG